MSYKERISAIGERLYLERVRLGLNEISCCTAIGVNLDCLSKYEAGEKEIIGTHLQKIAELGFDVLFVVTGISQTDNNQADESLDTAQGGSKTNKSKRASYTFTDSNSKTCDSDRNTTLTLTSETGKSTTLWCDSNNPEKILEIAVKYLNA